jgi:hypothetical protein
MGEHWVHPIRVADGIIDPAKPQALSYAMLDGRPELLGVIFATPVRAGDTPPASPAGVVWHDHTESIDEEAALIGHMEHGEGAGPEIRLAMLHAWVWLENPDGAFAPDNWALPFVRLGLDPPARVSAGAARALSLPSGGDDYYLHLVEVIASPTRDGMETARTAIRGARADVDAWIRALQSTGAAKIDAGRLDRLEAIWSDLWRTISAAVPDDAAKRLAMVIG